MPHKKTDFHYHPVMKEDYLGYFSKFTSEHTGFPNSTRTFQKYLKNIPAGSCAP